MVSFQYKEQVAIDTTRVQPGRTYYCAAPTYAEARTQSVTADVFGPDRENSVIAAFLYNRLADDLATSEYEGVAVSAKAACLALADKAAYMVASAKGLTMAAWEEDGGIELMIDRKGSPKCAYLKIDAEGKFVRVSQVNGPKVIQVRLKVDYVNVGDILSRLLM